MCAYVGLLSLCPSARSLSLVRVQSVSSFMCTKRQKTEGEKREVNWRGSGTARRRSGRSVCLKFLYVVSVYLRRCDTHHKYRLQ